MSNLKFMVGETGSLNLRLCNTLTMSVSTWLPGMNYSIACNLIWLTCCIEYDVILQEIASSDIVKCVFSHMIRFKGNSLPSSSSDWDKLRDIIKYKIEQVVTRPRVKKFVF